MLEDRTRSEKALCSHFQTAVDPQRAGGTEGKGRGGLSAGRALASVSGK